MIPAMIRPPSPIFQVGHLERLPLGMRYTAVVAHVRHLLTKLPGHPELVIDFTGVGRPIFDMFVDSGITPIGVLITGGMTEAQDGLICSVPKLNLVSRLQALFHEGRLKILRELDEAETWVRELQDFRTEYTPAGHLTFNARSGKHDDLVLAVAIAVWRAHGGGMAGSGYFEYLRRKATGWVASEPRYFVGVDLGQSRDPTAIAVVRRVEPLAPVPEDARKPKRCYAPGSLEWAEEQRRREERRPAFAAAPIWCQQRAPRCWLIGAPED